MASWSLPPGLSDNSTRSPIRQNVALSWLDKAAPATVVSKPARSPVKKWPPPKFDDSVRASAITPTTMSGPTAGKQETVSTFQSVRAMFEAKKPSDAATPPPPPSRRRLTFPIPPDPPIVKHYSAESDLSSSSCSTVDSESDRKMKESAETNHEPKLSSQKPLKMESTRTSPSEQAHNKVSPCNVAVAYPPNPPVVQNPVPPEPAAIVTSLKHSHPNNIEIDPFRLLLPVTAVPTLPNEVICVYDSAAVEMEKNVKKVVRKLLKKNKTKLEEFKVNSRLFGTDFMDARAYLDTLIKEFGPIRALQLVPCLLSIQPNLVRSNALLLTSKNYLLQHEAELEREFQSLQLSNQKEVTKTNATSIIGPSATTNVAEKAFVAEPVAIMPSAISPETPSKHNAKIPTRESCGSSVPGIVNATTFPHPAPKHTAKSPAAHKVIRPGEPMPEPHEVTPPRVPPPLINVVVSTSKPPVRVPTTKEAPPVKMRAELNTSSDNEEGFRAESLFWEPIKLPSPSQTQKHNRTFSVPEPPPSPASSTRSYEEAESLFGERISLSSPSNVGQRKSVTWGNTKAMGVRSEKTSPVKTVEKPAPLLFGMATAAAFDSDESDFSD